MALGGLLMFDALVTKRNYLEKRNTTVTENIANVNTPGYIEHDIGKFNFKADVLNSNAYKGQVVMTNGRHFNKLLHLPDGIPESKHIKSAYESKPTGNNVSLEEQAALAGQISVNHDLMTSLYKKQIQLYQMVLK